MALGVDTHTHIQTCTHTDVRTKSILRNQARAGLWPARTWFNKYWQIWAHAIGGCIVAYVTYI